MNRPWQTIATPVHADTIAPDRSAIRLLAATERASMVHCTLAAGGVTRAVRHRTVDELWYFLEGTGQVWRSVHGTEEITEVRPGLSLSIPTGTAFQFRAGPHAPLTFIIVTIPPWPGDHEAEFVPGHWPS
jgi:mannose-6-phosphate isomerase-like protein (cupin superfamily)